jgi:hypothetical protein
MDRAIKGHWSKRQSKSALLYAASTMNVADNRTLLDGLLDGTATYDAYRPLLVEWFDRSRFVTEKVLAGLVNATASAASNAVLLTGKAVEVALPAYSSEAAKEIRDAFPPS